MILSHKFIFYNFQADFKIQTMIVKGLNLFFPKLKIIGE